MTNLVLVLICTAYCHCAACTAPFNDGITASGVKPVEDVTAAMNGVPFGTVLEIEVVGRRIVQDRMSKRYQKTLPDGTVVPLRVDIYFDSHQRASEFGKQKRKVRIVR